MAFLNNTNIIDLKSVDSTNSYALKNIDKLKHFDLVIAETQTEGKGRNGNFWQSPKGNLYSSIVFKEKINQFHIPFLISLSVKKTIDDLFKSAIINNNSKQMCLKWPNDIYVFDKIKKEYAKLGGVLSVKQDEGIIIGLGLNVFIAPKIDNYKTISLKDLLLDIEPKILIKLILKNFKEQLEIYKKQGFDEIKKTWLEFCCHYKKEVSIDNKQGVFIGVDENGFALLSIKPLSINNLSKQRSKLLKEEIQTLSAGSLNFY